MTAGAGPRQWPEREPNVRAVAGVTQGRGRERLQREQRSPCQAVGVRVPFTAKHRADELRPPWV